MAKFKFLPEPTEGIAFAVQLHPQQMMLLCSFVLQTKEEKDSLDLAGQVSTPYRDVSMMQ